jgi:hypothetical protein
MAMESIINYVMVLLMLLLATYGSCSEAGTDSSTAELQGGWGLVGQVFSTCRLSAAPKHHIRVIM